MTELKITKLPPGKAYGADDLQNWAHRRLMGNFGVYDRKAIKKQVRACKET